MEEESFFEKLGRSLKLEDEQYEESSTNAYPQTPSAEEEPAITPEEYAESMEEEMSTEQGEEETGEDELEKAQALEAYEQNTFNNNKPKTNLAVAKTSPKSKQAAQKQNMAKQTSEEKVEKVETNVTPEQEEEGRLTIDVYETDNEIVIKSTIAGVEPEDLDINITSDSVTVRGKRQKDEEISTEDYFYQECYWGAFSRSVILPTEIDADKADATIKNGVLTIRLPKLSKTQQKKLQVKAVS